MVASQLIESVKAVEGKNVAYCSEDKCIYYSPNKQVKKQQKNKNVVENNLPDLFKAMKQFKSEHPDEKVKIINV
jgi:hypothetical protein